MKVLERAIYRGPNIYDLRPMIRLMVALGDLTAWPADQLSTFSLRLRALVETLPSSELTPPTVVSSSEEPASLADLILETALNLQRRAGAAVTHGLTRPVRGQPDVFQVLYGYHSEAAGLLAGGLSLALINHLLPATAERLTGLSLITPDVRGESGADLERAFDLLKTQVRQDAPDPSAAALLAEAARRDIPFSRLGALTILGQGHRARWLHGSVPGTTAHPAVMAAGDLQLTRTLLDQVGVPVPSSTVVQTADEAVRAARRLGGPVTVRTLGLLSDRRMHIDGQDERQLRRAFEWAAADHAQVMIEEALPGQEYRLLVVGGQVVAATAGQARLTDDRGDSLAHHLGTGPADAEALQEVLGEQVMEPVSLNRPQADLTAAVHPQNVAVARTAALSLGLDVAEVTLTAPDIQQSVRETGGGVVTVGAAPDLGPFLAVAPGEPQRLTAPLMDLLYPPGVPSRVPLVALTGTNGKSTTARMVAHVMATAGHRVGLTTTSGVYVGGDRIHVGDATGPRSARMVLRHPEVTAAVLETARGGLLREGLGFDRCDVAAVLNVQADHLGLGGIDTLEDLSWVKSLLVRVVHPQGLAVLNADDPLTLQMRAQSAAPVALFSLQGDDPTVDVRQHLADGGWAVLRRTGEEGDHIVVAARGQVTPLMATAEIPATLGGQAMFNVANALAVCAICLGMGIALDVIREALRTFGASFEQNPGRMNIFDGHPFRVVLDYAHNPAGLEAQRAAIRPLCPPGGRLIGMVSIPGDRRDEDIRAVGAAAAASFDELIFREGADGRGRARGEVMALMREGALHAGFPEDRIQLVLEEADAVDATLRTARPGDLVVIMPTNVERVWHQIQAFESGGAQARQDA